MTHANDERRSAIQHAQERHDRAHAEVERLAAELLRAEGAFRTAQIDLIDAKKRTLIQGGAVDRTKQEAMDGSPARVVRTLDDLRVLGKFSRVVAVLDSAAHLDDEVIRVRFQ